MDGCDYQVEPPDEAGRIRVRFRGVLRSDPTSRAAGELRARIGRGAEPVILDLSRVEAADASALALLLALRRRLARDRVVELVRPESRAPARLVAAIGEDEPRQSLRAAPGGRPALERIGRGVALAFLSARDVLTFTGEFTWALARVLRRPRFVNWRDVPVLLERAGADALPIVATINFLVGTTLALQGAIQLRAYGLDVYVADSVALATVRSLGPLMCAIIVAGRSGAGIAAEIGSMKVDEEIDALRTLGLHPMGFLVLPRVLALVVAVPLLAVFADAASIAGGLLVGILALDLTMYAYLERTLDALSLAHVFSGLFKSVFFGLAIAMVACQRGLQTRGGAEGVGRSTTTSVVWIIFFLVALEALFTALFHVWDI